MLKRRRDARCTAVADLVLMNSQTQKILCCIVAILFSTNATALLCARRALQRWYLQMQDLIFQMLCRSFTYHVQLRKYRHTKSSPSFLITLYYIYSKTNQMHQCIKFIIFCNDTLHVSDGLSVHHQDFKTVHTATGVCQTDTALCLLASRTPDDGRKDRPKHVECHSKI